mmetsp:Transcript_44004/g.109724  ORF Transcript_44004/g.109724 Transcript_44004/m.109724 type:complete len:231 (-) Transcript_44004:729-1421(-)
MAVGGGHGDDGRRGMDRLGCGVLCVGCGLIIRREGERGSVRGHGTGALALGNGERSGQLSSFHGVIRYPTTRTTPPLVAPSRPVAVSVSTLHLPLLILVRVLIATLATPHQRHVLARLALRQELDGRVHLPPRHQSLAEGTAHAMLAALLARERPAGHHVGQLLGHPLDEPTVGEVAEDLPPQLGSLGVGQLAGATLLLSRLVLFVGCLAVAVLAGAVHPLPLSLARPQL